MTTSANTSSSVAADLAAMSDLSLAFKPGLVYTGGRDNTRLYIIKTEGRKVHVIRLRDSAIGTMTAPFVLRGGELPTKAEQKQIDALMAEEREREDCAGHAWFTGEIALLSDRSKVTARKAGMDPDAAYVVVKVNAKTIDVVPLGTTNGVDFLRMHRPLLIPAKLTSIPTATPLR